MHVKPAYFIIVAMTDNRIIGHENQMPWRQASDLKHFKMLTYGKPIIMGRKTFTSIGKPLVGRDNIILTRNTDFAAEILEAHNQTSDHSISVVHSKQQADDRAQEYAKERGVEDVAIIGGADIYQTFLPDVTKIYLTEIHTELEGDTKFPELDMTQWRETKCKRHQASEKDDYDFSFVILEKV